MRKPARRRAIAQLIELTLEVIAYIRQSHKSLHFPGCVHARYVAFS
jgi:hypothetical protein